MINFDKIIPKHAFGEITREKIETIPSDAEILEYIKSIGYKVLGREMVVDPSNETVILQLVRWAMGDPGYAGELNKGIGLIGPPGTGKTKLLEILANVISIDSIRFRQYYREWNRLSLNFELVSATAICMEYQQRGPDGLFNFLNRPVLAIDDLGIENGVSKHYGSTLDVISHVIMHRYDKRKITLFTANLQPDGILSRYGERIYSRLKEMVTIFELAGADRRGIYEPNKHL